MRFTVVSVACLLIGNLLVQSSLAQEAERPEQVQVAIRMGGELTAEELAVLLGAHVWKFDVFLPEGVERVSANVYEQPKGKERSQFGVGIDTSLKPHTKRQVLVAMVPIGGESLSDAEKVRVTMIGFDMVASRTVANPLYKMGIGKSAGLPDVAEDGTFSLIGGYKSGPISSPYTNADCVISLEIKYR